MTDLLCQFARMVLLVGGSAWSVGGFSHASAQARTKDQAASSPFAAVDTSVTVVPAAYTKQDAAVIFRRLETLRRGPYESTSDVELRLRKALAGSFLSLPAGGTFCAIPEIEYDADSAVVTVSVSSNYPWNGLTIQCTAGKSERYVGRNAFGVRANVLRRHYLQLRIVPNSWAFDSKSLYSTLSLPIDRATASVVFPRLRSLLVFEPSVSREGHVAHRREEGGGDATITLPVEVVNQVRTIYARSAFLWIYDRAGGAVLRKVQLF